MKLKFQQRVGVEAANGLWARLADLSPFRKHSLFDVACWFGVGLCLWVSWGCQNENQIRKYVLPREKTGIPEEVRMPMMAQSPTAATVKSRMMTAIGQFPQATWFFKTVGPVEDMNQIADSITTFLKVVKFDANGRPSWELPQGWEDAGSNADRFRTLRIPVPEGRSIEMSISELSPNQDLPMNVNRWRASQLKLEPLAPDAAVQSLKELPCEGGKFLLFDEVGMYSGGMGSPNSNLPAGHPPTGAASGETGVSSEPSASIDFVPIEGWNRVANAMFAVVKLEKSDGEKRASISVSELDAKLNTWDSGIGSWLAELDLSEMKTEQLEPFVAVRSVGGEPAKLIKLIIPDAARAIVAVRLERQGRAWYFKLAGDRELVDSVVPEFEKFLDSIKFK